MKINEVKKLLNTGESETVEFKKSTALLDAAFETICAFLNGIGGVVIIGVNDKGKIIGQDVEDSTRKKIAAHEAKIWPQAQLQITYPKIEGRTLVVLKVDTRARAPYTYDGRPYKRLQSTTVTMAGDYYDELLSRRNQINHSWEKCITSKLYEVIKSCCDIEIMMRVIRTGVDKKRLPESALQETPEKILE